MKLRVILLLLTINHQPLSAIKVGDAIFEKIEKIALNPLAYKECPELTTNSRIYRQASYLSWYIIFKVTMKEIIILGIIHHSRKPSHLEQFRNKK